MSTYLAPPAMSSTYGPTDLTSTHCHVFPSRPPLPRRLLSLQHNVPSTPRQPTGPPLSAGLVTPSGYDTGLNTPPSSGPRRPGAPKRSHSFCGDTSKSTYALASASSCAHLTADKTQLVAPPLERTLSSIGCKGNRSPPSQQMARPLAHSTGVTTPPTPPASPPETSYPFLPQITIQPTSPPHNSTATNGPTLSPTPKRPTRPSLSPYQPNSLGITRGDLSVPKPSSISRPVRPSLAHLRNLSGTSMNSDMTASPSSRSSSYSLATPGTPRLVSLRIEEEDEMRESRSSFAKGLAQRRRRVDDLSNGDEDEEEDLMEVDGMVERVEDLSMVP